jgi:cation:H+ antiporter
MFNLLFLIIGFVPLVYGANILVSSASSLARKLNIPNMVIGLTIVAFGTSAPEFTVNVFASINNNNSIVLGNIVGSNIFNILVILGIASIIYPLAVNKRTTWIEIPLCFLAALVMFVISSDVFLDEANFSVLKRTDGAILLLFFVIFMAYTIQFMINNSYDGEEDKKQYPIILSILLIILGLALLVAGGKIIVKFAVELAKSIGISERVIALTIIAVGTSLPELATSIIAALKKNIDIAVGNIVGSNIFNSFFILGISAVINPITVEGSVFYDLCINMLASLLLFIFIFTGKGREMERREGIIFTVIYVVYVITLVKPGIIS